MKPIARFMRLLGAEIKAIRESYGLTQRSFSTLLGMGEVTIHRYENGSIPDEVHNQLLHMVQSPWNMNMILKMRSKHLPEYLRDRVYQRVNQLILDEYPDKMVELATTAVRHKGPDIFTGYKPFEPEKLMDMITFFSSDEDGVYKTKMNKLLWYSDFIHFRDYGVSVSGTPYVHLPYGPCADQYELFLGHLVEEKRIMVEEVYFDGGSGELLIAKQSQTQVFSSSANSVLSAVRDYFRTISSKEISNLSHDELGYVETNACETISYSYADRLKAGPKAASNN